MPIQVCLVTENVHEYNNPAVYDRGRVVAYASAENPMIEVLVPMWPLANLDDPQFADYRRVVDYLRFNASYTRDDRVFGQGSVSYFLRPSGNWSTKLLATPRPYLSLSFDPGLFMAMVKGRGIPEFAEGNEAIQLVNWLRETFTVVRAGGRVPTFAAVEVKSMGDSSSVIEITVDKAYASLLIGKGGLTIKAIREGIAAMYGHKFAIVIVKTV